MRQIMTVLVACAALLAAAQAPVAVRWEMGQNDAEPGWYSSRLVVKNISGHALDREWQLFFNQFSRTVKLPVDAPVDVQEVSTTYYRVAPNAHYTALAAGDSMVVDLLMRGTMVNYCYRPQGAHLVLNGDMSHPLPIDMACGLLDKPGQWRTGVPYPDGEYMWAYNERINAIGDAYTGNDYDIFPTPKQVEIHDGYSRLGSLVTIELPLLRGKLLRGSRRARQLLVEELRRRGIYTAAGQSTRIKLLIAHSGLQHMGFDAYHLTVNQGEITIVAANPEGLLNGVKTLVAAIDHSKGRRLQNVDVRDGADIPQRGFMLDIARNFTGYDDLKRFIDLLSYYKINRFQFHFTDDEAWRLEIPGLPELTEVCSRRGCTLTERDYLAQIFDGNGNPDDPTQSANGYITRKQFIELLRYAHQRGIKVVPEIETPGHARAAIVAMRARHDKYAAANPALANEYVLWDDENTSVYTSAQSYHDNVLNVASDGVYRFLTKVVDELALMYKAAGLKLDVVHLGGDEVAMAAWSQSPAVQALMQREGISDAHGVSEYYLRRITGILYPRGIRIEGWQEVAQNHSAEFNAEMTPRIAGVNAWSTVGKRDVVPYQIANSGYPVILSNVTNFYMDMGYSWHQYEQGLHWGGKVDELDSWSALPWNIYASARTQIDGTPIDPAGNSTGKPALEHRENIVGVQAQLWAETIRNFDQVQYLALPKVLGLVERGWNASPAWAANLADPRPYHEAMHQYSLKIGTRELPLLASQGYNFRIGPPGIHIEGGMVHINTQYPGVKVHYTLDGSEPTQQSPLWTAPVPLPDGTTVVKARAYYLNKESVTTQQRL
ncbi:MAG: family 20 glycosylhydrolase [Muribaculaceae bacterium]|nr:family 20 glycosylhydrolase [Muribaculaceae bacterium]